MYKIFKRLLLAAMVLFSTAAIAQGPSQTTVKGTIYNADHLTPLANILVSSRDAMTGSVSDQDGTFEIVVRDPYAKLEIYSKGYFTQSVELMGRSEIKIYLQSESAVMSSGTYNNVTGDHYNSEKTTVATTVNTKDMSAGYTTIDDALVGRIAGLNIINKGGSVGEGSYYSVRGIRSLYSENAPLVVVDGIPILVNTSESDVITGMSRNVFNGTSFQEIESVTLLKGSEALAYGSLGSNGVLSITTEQGIDQETTVELTSVNSISYLDKTLPLMNSAAYRSYAAEVGSSYYTDATDFATNLPFLFETSSGIDSYKYNYDTDWQDLIYTPAFTTNNMLKVKGGDEAVKFMFAFGYVNSEGALDGTYQNKISTRGNANINFSPKLSAYASVAFTYNDMSVQEQGMTSETNPVLAAYEQIPLLDVYQRNVNGTLTNSFSEVEDIVGASNPVAIISEGITSSARSYDLMINTGVTYNPSRYFNYNLDFGINYAYTKDDIFIGGKTTNAIAALEGGTAYNTVRSGASEDKSYFVRGAMQFDKTYNEVNNVRVDAVYQLMTSSSISTTGKGINTSGDSYTTLGNTASDGREAYGYLDVWNWMSAYATASYIYNSQLYASVTMLGDAASTYGIYSNRLYFYPSANVGWRAKNSTLLRDNKLISNLTVRGDYSIIPNSRFETSYGSYYYELELLSNISGLTRANIPNQDIAPEEVHSIDLGVDLALARNRLSFSLDLYQEDTRNMLVEEEISPIYGFTTMYDNSGSIRTRGIELGFSASVINKPNFQWIVSGTISTYSTKITSLGGSDQQIIDYSDYDDDVYLINKVGSSPYEFYGYVYEGVYATTADAEAAGLKTTGGYSYSGGDAIFSDLNGDGIISDADMTSLGSAIPDFFGGIQTRLRYKKFTLFANFSYSVGNEAYNAVRRSTESGDSFTNQASSLERRWMAEGDVTDIPRAVYGDPGDNNRFSSRWIEDASYIKLKELTLSYDHKQKFLFFNSINIFVSAENLFTITNYTGLDPEFAYSYDSDLLGMDLAKVTLPKYVKLGLVLNF